MPPALRRRLLCASVLIALTVAGAGPLDAGAAQGQKQVLVLYSTRRDARIAVVGDRELPHIIETGLPEGVDYYSEFIDQARFPQVDYQAAFRDFLRRKYEDHTFDLVIAMGDVALEFVDSTRNVLFTEAPVVFFASRPSPRRPANSTGLTAELNLYGTVVLAAALQPDTRHVFVVSGAEQSNLNYASMARGQFQRFASRFAFTYLSALPTKELEARLESLPEHSIVYYLVVDRDGANEAFHPLEYLDRVTAASRAPVYSWVDSAMDHGIVGGSLKDQQAQTEAIGQLALRVLRGEQADSIPTSSPDLNVAQVDWRQLRRWNIAESRVPAGTIVKFREPSAWERYKIYILGAIAIVLAQTMLIAGLLVQRARRRQAEEQVRGNEAALRMTYQRIRDLGARLLHAQETERSRIARELHDDISQQLAVLTIDLELLGGAQQAERQQLADEALSRAHGIARSVHALSHRLHPAKLRLIGLIAALNALQHELSQSEIAIKFTHDNVPPALPPDLTLSLFRIVQEALQNAIKYSGAHEVRVHLAGDQQGLTLTIADDGVGFDVDAAWGKGLGLVSMGERVEAVGGTFDMRSKPGAGTRLEIKVPLAAIESASVAV